MELALGAPDSSQSDFMVCENTRKLSLTSVSEAFSFNRLALGLLLRSEWIPSYFSSTDLGLLAGYRINSGPVRWAVCDKGSTKLCKQEGKMKMRASRDVADKWVIV